MLSKHTVKKTARLDMTELLDETAETGREGLTSGLLHPDGMTIVAQPSCDKCPPDRVAQSLGRFG